jgi:hypothetical protein
MLLNLIEQADAWGWVRPLEQGIPAIVTPDISTGRIPLDPRAQMRTPEPDNVNRGHIDSWNLTLERRLPLDLVVSTSYVGTASREGYADIELNAGEPGTGTSGAPLAVQFGRTSSTLSWGSRTRANYHALQVAVNRPFVNGLLVRGAYTLSKAMNELDDDGWATLMWSAPSQIERNYALAGYDRTHVLQIGVVYALPFGKGDRTAINAIIRDWQVNGTLLAYSGTPFTVTASNSALDQRGNLQTADLVGPVKSGGEVGPDNPYYDPSAWANVTERRYGNTGRNQFYGPGFWNYHMSVFRTFAMPGRTRLQFKVEGFHVTNHPQWGNPNGSVTSGNFMRITSTRSGTARYVRLGLKLDF